MYIKNSSSILYCLKTNCLSNIFFDVINRNINDMQQNLPSLPPSWRVTTQPFTMSERLGELRPRYVQLQPHYLQITVRSVRSYSSHPIESEPTNQNITLPSIHLLLLGFIQTRDQVRFLNPKICKFSHSAHAY